MNRIEKVSILIDDEIGKYELDVEYQTLLEDFPEITTYKYPVNKETIEIELHTSEIHFYPTYFLLDNGYCFEDSQYSESGEFKVPYDKFLNATEIKSLSFFDYSGEKIYRLHIQENSDYDWERTKANNLLLISTKLIEYLNSNPLTKYNEETLRELKFINSLSKICLKHGSEMLFLFN